MGKILIFAIPSSNLNQLELSGNIYPSPHPSAHSPSISRHAAQTLSHKQARSFTAPLRSPVAPTKSCSIPNSASHNTPHTRAQARYTPGIDHPLTMSSSPSQTHGNSERESAAGANSNTVNPFLRFTSRSFSLSTWAKLMIRTGINRALRDVELPVADSQQAQSRSLESSAEQRMLTV